MATQNDDLEVERLKLEYRLARLEAQESAQKDLKRMDYLTLLLTF